MLHDFASYAESAYAVYAESVAAVSPGFSLPAWEFLPVKHKAAWEAAAVRVARLACHSVAERGGTGSDVLAYGEGARES